MIRNPNPDDATRAVAYGLHVLLDAMADALKTVSNSRRVGHVRERVRFYVTQPQTGKRAWRAPLSLASRELIVSSGKFDLSLCRVRGCSCVVGPTAVGCAGGGSDSPVYSTARASALHWGVF